MQIAMAHGPWGFKGSIVCVPGRRRSAHHHRLLHSGISHIPVQGLCTNQQDAFVLDAEAVLCSTALLHTSPSREGSHAPPICCANATCRHICLSL